jgi:aryl carrier-like protein
VRLSDHAYLAGERQDPGGQRHDADVHADDEPGDQRLDSVRLMILSISYSRNCSTA